MKSIGIIAEFNPFHQGHSFLIEKAKKENNADTVVAVMSGSFVQRGELAAYDKWTRAEEAVKNGVNLVVELPVVFSCSSAAFFAYGGVKILEGFGCIDYLAFGSECGVISTLQKTADFFNHHEALLHDKITDLMKEGNSYPRAREMAVKLLSVDLDLSTISEPNNILAVEYLRYVKSMQPWTVKRLGEGHHLSASQLRTILMNENTEIWTKRQQAYWQMVCSAVLCMDPESLRMILSAGGGLSDKLKKEIRYASSEEELLDRLKSKAYTHTRIRRMLAQTLLRMERRHVEQAQPYIRILALDSQGAAFLREVRKRECAGLPLITNINQGLRQFPKIQETLDKDVLASDLYNLANGRDLYACSDYVTQVRRVW